MRRSISGLRVSERETIIYGLIDPCSQYLRYVGKTAVGVERRRRIHLKNARAGIRTHLCNWLRGLIALGMEPEAVDLETVPPGGDWVEAEQFWIGYFRFVGCPLVNLCDGGQGTTGIRFTSDHIEKLRRGHFGIKRSEEAKRKTSESLKANWANGNKRKHTAESYKKMHATRAERRAAGLYKKRVPASPETKAKISAARKGTKLTAEHRRKLSEVRKGKQIGRKMSAEARAKMSVAHKGVPLSPSHRVAVAAANRARARSTVQIPARSRDVVGAAMAPIGCSQEGAT